MPGPEDAAATGHTLRALEEVIGPTLVIFQHAPGVDVVSPCAQLFFRRKAAVPQYLWSPRFHIHSIALLQGTAEPRGMLFGIWRIRPISCEKRKIDATGYSTADASGFVGKGWYRGIAYSKALPLIKCGLVIQQDLPLLIQSAIAL